ncbi:MAG: hypothetical protein A2Y84_00740 [Candidatus Colwellbacteria bacterium RBG_13_48_8]|uniref:Ferric oxidoreductase domain-containing protein n=1 Tax=Candidatus Colwellbacteria bacterium RBG_13_48_8 TaxID=1797685 RepID=A0A1G1YX76_9BACT|nr:MAG: hypothetical protein A2Y84_00740 [Candidatus Colwellbacteria bacterium RBG_13_48_8]
MKYLILTLAYLSVLYPLWVWYQGASLVPDRTIIFEIFPALGLLAFVIMWLHIVGGALRGWLGQYIDFDKFVASSSALVLVLLILHPALLLLGIGKPSQWGLVFRFNDARLIWIAIVAWLIFIAYDLAKRHKAREFFIKHWGIIKLVSTLGFFLILAHSLGLGRDLQEGPLRVIWMIYGITAALAAIYTYGVKRILRKE